MACNRCTLITHNVTIEAVLQITSIDIQKRHISKPKGQLPSVNSIIKASGITTVPTINRVNNAGKTAISILLISGTVLLLKLLANADICIMAFNVRHRNPAFSSSRIL
ncbi:hypothetical protein T4D_1367 [Trichinella pseudospiralis]|uniref:Uncharacterized protein n=1 Tax=Trichinella pseudospiralis TaxID=6337 RepID=A0A0V1FEY3_TRIPS|nr:hypothetical protein T4D_1367 [Trichinella pseudospiralis]